MFWERRNIFVVIKVNINTTVNDLSIHLNFRTKIQIHQRKKKEKRQPVGRNSFAAVTKVKQSKNHKNDVYECFNVLIDEDQINRQTL